VHTHTYFELPFSGSFSPIELDGVLLKRTGCIELALSYAKTWSKYTKSIVSWVEKKLNLGELSFAV
jgi:hypothetical protein